MLSVLNLAQLVLKYSHLFNIAYILFDLFNLQPKKSNDHFWSYRNNNYITIKVINQSLKTVRV